MSATWSLALFSCLVAGINAQSQSLQADLDLLTSSLNALQNRVTQLEANNQKVAFSVYISGPDVQAVRGDKLIFGDTIVNTGDAYNTTTGEFIAPVAGDYFFIVNCDVSEDYQDLIVNKNGDQLFEADKDDWASTHVSGSVISSLQPGDVITTNHYSSRGEVDNGRESTFSGFLI